MCTFDLLQYTRGVTPGGVGMALAVSLLVVLPMNLLSGLHFVTGTKSALFPLQVKYLWLPYFPLVQPLTS